jgi:hypothetical protein
MEVLGNNVAGDTCESHRTLAPLLETKVELVVLHPLNAANILLLVVSSHLKLHIN